MASEEALQIAVKRREVKSKGEKERYSHRMQSSKEQQGEIKKKKKRLPQQPMQRNREKQHNGKDQRSLQENERYQGNI